MHTQVQFVCEMINKGFIAFVAFAALFLALTGSSFSRFASRGDFGLRISEAKCLWCGVNPFDVWRENVVFRPYVSNTLKGPRPEGCTVQVNAYVPWAYTFILPFSFLPPNASWAAYVALMTLALLCVSAAGSMHLKRLGFLASEALLCSALALGLVFHGLWSNACTGNYAAFSLCGAVLMGVCLQKRHDFLAGVCWSLSMLKPQLALLLSVPLLMRGRVASCAVAAAICLVASILPSRLCHASFFEMLLQGPAANVEFFQGCGTWPKFLCGLFGQSGDILAGTLIGLGVCIWMTWLLRRERDWLVFLMPAAVCSSCWTYTQAYSHAMGWLFGFALVSELMKRPRDRFLWALAVLSVPVFSRAFLAWHGFCMFFGYGFPMSDYAFRVGDSLNSTLSLALAAAFCVYTAVSVSPVKILYNTRHEGQPQDSVRSREVQDSSRRGPLLCRQDRVHPRLGAVRALSLLRAAAKVRKVGLREA